MKVGKKVLSCVLAIMMIVSSVSVCFSSLGAVNAIDNLMNRIELHHATLADLIDATESPDATEEDFKRIPQQVNASQWKVEVDSATSSWHWVAGAYERAAKEAATNAHTYYGIYEAVKAEIKEVLDEGTRQTALVSLAQYDEILKYFAFGETEDKGFYNSPNVITLYIGAGFDVLEWADGTADAYKDIPATEDDLKLYNGTLKFTMSTVTDGYGINPDDVTFVQTVQDSAATAAAMNVVKSSIERFIKLADTGLTEEDPETGEEVTYLSWFNTDFNALAENDPALLNLTVTQISEKIVEYEEEAKSMLKNEKDDEKKTKIENFLKYLNEYGVEDDDLDIINEEYEKMKA